MSMTCRTLSHYDLVFSAVGLRDRRILTLICFWFCLIPILKIGGSLGILLIGSGHIDITTLDDSSLTGNLFGWLDFGCYCLCYMRLIALSLYALHRLCLLGVLRLLPKLIIIAHICFILSISNEFFNLYFLLNKKIY